MAGGAIRCWSGLSASSLVPRVRAARAKSIVAHVAVTASTIARGAMIFAMLGGKVSRIVASRHYDGLRALDWRLFVLCK